MATQSSSTDPWQEYLGIPGLKASRQFRSSQPSASAQGETEGFSPILMPDEVDSNKGTAFLGNLPRNSATAGFRMAGDIMGLRGQARADQIITDAEVKSAKTKAEADKAASKQGFWGSLVKTGLTIAGTAAAACDERLKWDMAPLRGSDVNDVLAELAFTVKAIRERA